MVQNRADFSWGLELFAKNRERYDQGARMESEEVPFRSSSVCPWLLLRNLSRFRASTRSVVSSPSERAVLIGILGLSSAKPGRHPSDLPRRRRKSS
jgi:hypothetical protein